VDLVPSFHLHEEAPEALRRYVACNAIEVAGRTGLRDGQVTDIRGEDLDGDVRRRIAEMLQQANGNGVDFLARRASGDPDADRLGGRPVLEKAGENDVLQEGESLGVRKKLVTLMRTSWQRASSSPGCSSR